MSDTRVSVLTPPGSGAIATVEVAGPTAWELARRLFRPAGKKPLPDTPEPGRFWFGTLGSGVGDEVILALKQLAPEPVVEVHCHGGRRVVRMVVEQFQTSGESILASGDSPASLLPFAPTLRTASILLDQLHGAFDREVHRILALLDAGNAAEATTALRRLTSFAPVGRHLVEPWKVVIAGPPNVGKSSLVNALAGYQRAVVSAVAGTTRDVVTVPVAFDGWPVELADTAGLRDAAGLEGEGIELARRALGGADLVVWVMDASVPEPIWPDVETEKAVRLPTATGWIVVVNKADRSIGWPPNQPPGAIHLSALTGEGIPALAGWVARRLVPQPPDPADPVPFTPRLAELVETANAALAEERTADVVQHLRDCLPAG